jgi:pimeloyl-ACP methyl ester carboxylesterase
VRSSTVAQEWGLILFSIIFVHGLNGGNFSTWTHASSGTCWPRDLLPKKVPTARILSFGYDARFLDLLDNISQNTIHDHARNMLLGLSELRRDDNTSSLPIVLVAHSMGGLLVKRALILSRNAYNSRDDLSKHIVQHVKHVVFMGTPHQGSDMQTLAMAINKIFSVASPTKPNDKILSILASKSPELSELSKEFVQLYQSESQQIHFRLTCFFEELAYCRFGRVVEPTSATMDIVSDSRSLHANHKDMVRYSTKDDPNFQVVSKCLSLIVGMATK